MSHTTLEDKTDNEQKVWISLHQLMLAAKIVRKYMPEDYKDLQSTLEQVDYTCEQVARVYKDRLIRKSIEKVHEMTKTFSTLGTYEMCGCEGKPQFVHVDVDTGDTVWKCDGCQMEHRNCGLRGEPEEQDDKCTVSGCSGILQLQEVEMDGSKLWYCNVCETEYDNYNETKAESDKGDCK